MTRLPHLPWPFQLGATVAQGSIEDHQARAAVALCTPRGQREDVPGYGVTLPIFESAPIDVDTLERELLDSDATIDAEAIDVTELATATIARISIDVAGA